MVGNPEHPHSGHPRQAAEVLLIASEDDLRIPYAVNIAQNIACGDNEKVIQLLGDLMVCKNFKVDTSEPTARTVPETVVLGDSPRSEEKT